MIFFIYQFSKYINCQKNTNQYFLISITTNYKMSSNTQSQSLGSTIVNPQFKQYSYRIIITALYSLSSIINGMCWVVVTPISVPIQNAYSISAAWVAFIPMSYMIFYIFINFPSNWVIDVKGIKKGVVMGACLTLLGCAIRCLVKVGFPFVIIGQVFCAIAQPFIINAPMKIATRWFMPQNRSLAMAILTVVNIIGTAVGFIVPSLFVSDTDTPEMVRDHFFVLMLVEAIIAALSAILIIIFFKESPPTLPSLGSMVENTDFKQSIKILFKNKTFMMLALAFGTVNGTFNIYGSLMDDILDPYGYTPDQVSVFGAALMVTGIISAGIFGAYVERTLKYRRVFWLCSIVGILTTVGFPLALKFFTDSSKYYWAYMVLVILQGFVFIPLQPLTVDYGSDIMFPIGEAQITGFMLSVGQIFGVAFVEAAQLIFNLGNTDLTPQQQRNSSFNSVIFCNVFLAAGCIVLMFQNGQLKRAKLEHGKLEGEEESLILSNNTSVFTTSTNNKLTLGPNSN